ncbi:MAG: hypothetical protein WD055_00795 [Candidatus Dependentiae bacterium]
MLLFFLTLLIGSHVQAIIYSAGIWKDPANNHVIIGYGDIHLPDKHSCYQQYELIKGASHIPNAHMIVEDKMAAKTSRLLLLGPSHRFGKEIPLFCLHPWALAAGIKSSNIEFRPREDSVLGCFYAPPILKQYEQTLAYKNDFQEHNKKIIGEFEKYGLPILKKLQHYPFSMTNYNKVTNLFRSKLGLNPLPTYCLFSSREAHLLDLHILQKISEDRRKNRTSIVVAGGKHIEQIAPVIEKKGYQRCSYHEHPTEHLTEEGIKRHLSSYTSYNSNIDPINISLTYNAAAKHINTSETSPGLRTKATLNILRYRGLLEKSPLGHVNRIRSYTTGRAAGMILFGLACYKVSSEICSKAGL